MSGFGSLCTTLSLFLFFFFILSYHHSRVPRSSVLFFSLRADAIRSPQAHHYLHRRLTDDTRLHSWTRTALPTDARRVLLPYESSHPVRPRAKKRRNVYYTPFFLPSVRSLASHQAVGVSSSRLDARRDATDDINIDIICSMADGQ